MPVRSSSFVAATEHSQALQCARGKKRPATCTGKGQQHRICCACSKETNRITSETRKAYGCKQTTSARSSFKGSGTDKYDPEERDQHSSAEGWVQTNDDISGKPVEQLDMTFNFNCAMNPQPVQLCILHKTSSLLERICMIALQSGSGNLRQKCQAEEAITAMPADSGEY